MSAHRILADIGRAHSLQTIADPGDGGTMQVIDKSGGVLNITSAGSRRLPDNTAPGTIVIVVNNHSSSVNVYEGSGSNYTAVNTNLAAIFISTGDTTAATKWVSLVATAMTS